MEQINFKDFQIVPDINSVRHECIDDDTYFSKNYSGYVSNSRLGWIDPNRNGNYKLFQNPPKVKTSSLTIGSSVHELLLQPNEFTLAPKINKPNAKLGDVMDYISNFLKEGKGLDEAIVCAAKSADYFTNQLGQNKINGIKDIWLDYSKRLENLPKTDKKQIILSDADWFLVDTCFNSCLKNPEIIDKLYPFDEAGNPKEAHFEDAFFMDFIVIYKNRYCDRIPFKMKADNWTVDHENKIITLNDLKTTGHSTNKFMQPDGSWDKYCYARQMAVYSTILWYWLMKTYGVSKKLGWQLKANMLVVETIPNYWSRSFYVTDQQLKQGQKMFRELMSRVAYYNIFGDKEVEFV